MVKAEDEVKQMTDLKKEREKKPAHEAILKLMEIFHSLLEIPKFSVLEKILTETRIDALLSVLQTMVIPEKELPKVISRLEKIRQRAGYGVKIGIERTIKLIKE